MSGMELPEIARQWANDVLVWIGFGTVVGLLAKTILPGRDSVGAVTTLLMGIGGTVIGSGTLMFFWPGHRVTPISPVGLVVALAGAFVLLLFHRLLAGQFTRKGEEGGQRQRPPARKHATVAHDE